jgi:23S rRNA (adenine2503-C2)-methyltransferase
MLLNFQTLASHEDLSVNHVAHAPDRGMWECRYVHRTSWRPAPHAPVPMPPGNKGDYFICYLSSHTGCNKSCRFCHLTATKQTFMTDADVPIYLAQAAQVWTTYRERLAQGMPPVAKMHYNFMARGEPLANRHFLTESQAVFDGLAEQATAHGLPASFKVSSILPSDFTADLTTVLADERAELYYSLYSLNPAFRKRWLPKALPGEAGLDLVADYQQRTGRRIALHWAFIEGQNDSEADVEAVLDAVLSRGIRAKFNLVRYNPHDRRHGVEPAQAVLDARFARIQAALGEAGSRQVPRVGFDVKASCGMFIESL